MSALLNNYRSKKACPQCGAHKLMTSDSEKGSREIHYHCLSCNHQFFEHHKQKAIRNKEEAVLVHSEEVSKEATKSFWDRTDRVVVMAGGGAAIGGSVAQLPGAIVGVLVGVLYGWYIAFSEKSSPENS